MEDSKGSNLAPVSCLFLFLIIIIIIMRWSDSKGSSLALVLYIRIPCRTHPPTHSLLASIARRVTLCDGGGKRSNSARCCALACKLSLPAAC